jgi:hypothetical protein
MQTRTSHRPRERAALPPRPVGKPLSSQERTRCGCGMHRDGWCYVPEHPFCCGCYEAFADMQDYGQD